MRIDTNNLRNQIVNRIGHNSLFVTAISLIAVSIFYLYRMIFSDKSNTLQISSQRDSTIASDRFESYLKKNKFAVQKSGYLSPSLLIGGAEKQEETAKRMASELGVPIHIIDGEKLRETKEGFKDLLHRISSSKHPEFVFVSHADAICHETHPAFQTILLNTGALSKSLLLSLGVFSDTKLPASLKSRYRDQLDVDKLPVQEK